jgi:hypothetical protein
LNVEQVIRGVVRTKVPGSITLRTWLGVGDPGGYDYGDDFARLAASRPSDRGLFILANMAEWARKVGGSPDHPTADPYVYQILGGQGFLRDVGGLALPPRLCDDALATMAGTWQEDLRGRPFDETVRALEAIAALQP